MAQTYYNESQKEGIYTFTVKEDGAAQVGIADKIYGPLRIIQIEAHYEAAAGVGDLTLSKTSPDQEATDCILTAIDHNGKQWCIESGLTYLILAGESISVKTEGANTGTKTIKITYDRKNLR
jgi:hypothetical protein